MILQAKWFVGVGDLRRCTVGIGVGRLIVQLGVWPTVQKVWNKGATQRGTETGAGAQQSRSIIARCIVRRVAVCDALQKISIIDHCLNRRCVGTATLPVMLTEAYWLLIWFGAVNCALGSTANSSTGEVPGPLSTGVRRCDVEMQLGPLTSPADIAIEILHVGGLQIAPSILVQHGAGDIGGYIVDLLAVLEFTWI